VPRLYTSICHPYKVSRYDKFRSYLYFTYITEFTDSTTLFSFKHTRRYNPGSIKIVVDSLTFLDVAFQGGRQSHWDSVR